MTLHRWHAPLPRTLLVCVTAALASQVGPAVSTWAVLPAFSSASRSPSSDVMAQGLPLPSAGDTLAALAGRLPDTPGVVVVRGPVAAALPSYYVLSTHLSPRPILLVSCEPAAVRHFPIAADERRPIGWRIDLQPGGRPSLVAHVAPPVLAPTTWCAGGAP